MTNLHISSVYIVTDYHREVRSPKDDPRHLSILTTHYKSISDPQIQREMNHPVPHTQERPEEERGYEDIVPVCEVWSVGGYTGV